MTPELLATKEPDVIGHGQSQRFEIIGEPLAFMSGKKRHFNITVNDMQTKHGMLSTHEISFDEFGARFNDCFIKNECLFVTCYQWGEDGGEHEIDLSLWDYIYEHFYTVEEPHFTKDIIKGNRKLIEETLLNIIEGRY